MSILNGTLEKTLTIYWSLIQIASDQVFRINTRETEEHPAAAIPMDTVKALMQTKKMASTAPKTEEWPPSFDSKRDLSLFFKQVNDVAESNGWTKTQKTLHLHSQLSGDAQGCGHNDCYEDIIENLHSRFL